MRRTLGYLGLEMIEHARDELGRFEPGQRSSAVVLALRLQLHTLAEEWALVITFGQQMARKYPQLDAGWIGWAHALRTLGRTADAKAVLVEALSRRRRRDSAILRLKLASCHAALGEIDAAIEQSNQACRLDSGLLTEILRDPDFEPVWPGFTARPPKPVATRTRFEFSG